MCTPIIAGSLLVVPLHHQLDGRAHSEGCDTVLRLCFLCEERQKVHCLNTLFSNVGWGVGVGRGGRKGEDSEGGRERKEKRKSIWWDWVWLVVERLYHAHLANTAQLQIFAGLLRIFDSFHTLTVSASSQSYTCKLLHSQGKRSTKYQLWTWADDSVTVC